MKNLLFRSSDPAQEDFQYLEDLSTAYWYSEVLFTAIELSIFDFIEIEPCDTISIAQKASCKPDELDRLLKVLHKISIIELHDGKWFNNKAAVSFLVSKSPSFMGDFFLYRKYMQGSFKSLTEKISMNIRDKKNEPEEIAYEKKIFRYLNSTDTLARQKAKEIKKSIYSESWHGPILDVGGGGGALGRALMETIKHDIKDRKYFLFDLPEVIKAAKKLYPRKAAWKDITTIEGDFRTYDFDEFTKFGTIILSNFLHAYSEDEAKSLLLKAKDLLMPDGVILIHDYFPDRGIKAPHKGVFYDIAMMVNTYNGSCHECKIILKWLAEFGFLNICTKDLATDTSLIGASKGNKTLFKPDLAAGINNWVYNAVEKGFKNSYPIMPDKVITEPWVREKCRFGCDNYNKNIQCPPNGLDYIKTRKFLDSYKTALILEGSPPGREFHNMLLALEKEAFLAGFHKAFVFGAGPCTLCNKCPGKGECLQPSFARPAMEASGIDVYTTLKNIDVNLKPVIHKDGYVKYFGLLLLG